MGDEALKVMLSAARGVWGGEHRCVSSRCRLEWWLSRFGDLNLRPESYRREGDQEEPNIFHFPDGNATIPRLLVRKMIPPVAAGNTMEDIVAARFDYAQLDQPNSPVRVRLNSTVVRAQHTDNDLTKPVTVSYIRDGKARSVYGAKS